MGQAATAEDIPPERGAERLTETNPASNLQQLVDSGQIERGCVNVIGLDAVRERLGSKWALKMDWVHETVEGHIHRRLGDSGFSVRLGEVDVAIVVGQYAENARAITLNLLRELLDFFIGAQRYEDMRMAQVIWVRGDEIGCEQLDPRKIEPLDEHRTFKPGSLVEPAPKRRKDWSIMTFSTGDGRGLKLDLAYEPVLNLKNRVPILTRLRPLAETRDGGDMVQARWIEKLTPADQTAVIEAMSETAVALYEAGEVGVMAPCSLYTLATGRNRAIIVDRLQAVETKPSKPVVIELTDVDQGTPQVRLLDAVSLLAPHCRAVVVRVNLQSRPDPEVLRAARLAGQSIDCSGCDLREMGQRVQGVAQGGRPVGSLLFVFGLGSVAACEVAAAAGATHGGLNLPRPIVTPTKGTAH